MNLEERIQQLENGENTLEVERLIDDLRNYTLVSDDRLTKLENSEHFLYCLEAAGVDNWEGFSHAIDIRNEESDD